MKAIFHRQKEIEKKSCYVIALASATISFSLPAYAWQCNSNCKPWQPDCYAWKQINFSKCNRTNTIINDPQQPQEELNRQEEIRRQQLEYQQRQEEIRQENLRRQQFEYQQRQEQIRQENVRMQQEQDRQRQLLLQQNQARREQEIRNLGSYLNNMIQAESPRCKNYADERVSSALRQLTYGQGMSGAEMNRIGTSAFNECMSPVRQRADQIYRNEMQRINSNRY
jgi:flagellar biosynthesis GTPase FlhF